MATRRSGAGIALLAVSLLVGTPYSNSARANGPRPAAQAPRVHQAQDEAAQPAPVGQQAGAPASPLLHPKRPLGDRHPLVLRAVATSPRVVPSVPPPDPEVLGFAQSGEVAGGAWRSDLRFDLLTTIAYFGVTANGDGTLVTSDFGYSTWRSQALTDLMNTAHAAGDRVVLTVKAFDDAAIAAVTGAESTRQTLIATVLAELQQRGGDGVDIDFEGYQGSSEAPAFTTFVAELEQALRTQLPGQSYLTVDTFATAALGGTMFDLRALVPYADALDVMAYEFTGSHSSSAGPVAPLNGDWYNVTQTVNDYLTIVPPSQLILGVPYYGSKWSIASTGCSPAGCPAQAQVICCHSYDTYSGASDDLACASSLHQSWDVTFATPWASWFSPASGDTCGANRNQWRELYYENAASLGAKYDLVNARGLRGIGIWALGYDAGHSELWSEIAQKFTVTHAPTYSVQGLAAVQASTGFRVTWAPAGGSPPASHVVVWVREAGSSWVRWIDTQAASWLFFGFPGHTYDFFAQAYGPGEYNSGGPGPTPQATTSVTIGASRATPFNALYAIDGDGTLVPGSSPPQASAVWSYTIVRGLALEPGGQSGYSLDAYGGVHRVGGAPEVIDFPYWRGWDIARGIVVRANGPGGYVLDGWGGVHPFGGTPVVSLGAYWPGWDIARDIVVRPDGVSGYVLDGWGGIHPFGGAPQVPLGGYWPGRDIARAISLCPDGASGYVLDGWGGVHPFGAAPPAGPTAYWPGWDIARGIALIPGSCSAGYVVDGWGGIHPFGGAPEVVLSRYTPGHDAVRGLAAA